MQIRDLAAMSFDDLWSLHAELTKLLEVKILAEKDELEKRLVLLRRSRTGHELDLDNGDRSAISSYPKVQPKFRNTSAPYETWSGRGKQPRWLVEALKRGHEVEEFRIDNSKTPDLRIRQKGGL